MTRWLACLAIAGALALPACTTSPTVSDRGRPSDPDRDRDDDRTGDRDERRAEGPFTSEHPFEVEGTLRAVGEGLMGMGRTIAVARDDAPTAELSVAEEVRVTLEDRPARLADLREGDDVRVLFDFDGSRAVAIEIVAEPRRRDDDDD